MELERRGGLKRAGAGKVTGFGACVTRCLLLRGHHQRFRSQSKKSRWIRSREEEQQQKEEEEEEQGGAA